MKFAKTFCAPSSVIAVVPAGLPVRLQYNQFGLLEKFSIGFNLDLDPMYEDPDVKEFDYKSLFQRIRTIVPNSISTTGGTTWVYGVFYSDRIPCDEGVIPQALYQSYINDIVSGSNYTFYAGFAHSLAASFNGPLIIRNFLGASKFEVLPQVIVPVTMTDETLQMVMNPSSYPFKFSFIAGFFIFEDLKCRYASANLMQINVTNDINPYIARDGFLKGDVTAESGTTYTFNYSAIAHHEVEKKCTLLIETDQETGTLSIAATRLGPGLEKAISNIGKDVKCPVCGKVYRVGLDDSPVQCDDPHCLSVLYNDAVKMLTALKLPALEYSKYKELIKNKEIQCLTDILEVFPYKDKEIKTTLAAALYAIVPVSVVPNFDIFERFANKCNNNIESLVYYIQNPLRIQTDLDITDPILRRFATWLEDPYNITSVMSILSRVAIDGKLQKFDGAPIFRGNTIAITGFFKRGDYPEIESILMSYAAKVVPSIERGEDLPDVLLIGSRNEGISGEMVQKAKIHNIPIAYEDQFFEQYEIDSDMASNLL